MRCGGKQYRVEPGCEVNLERLPAEAGKDVELNEVLLIGGEGKIVAGQPLVAGAKVRARVIAQGKARRILVFHYKAKKNVRKRRGHRQPYTRVRIEAIETA